MIPESHDIASAARAIVGSDTPQSIGWVIKRLRSGQFSGFKARRQWRMTDADISAAIESLRAPHPTHGVIIPRAAATVAPTADRPILTSMTPTSRRRMAVQP